MKMPKEFPVFRLAVFVFALWLLVPAIVLYRTDHSNAGQIGDTFNIVNSLFSALAFVGVVYALYLQRVEMNESRKSQQEELRIALDSSRLQTISFLIDNYRGELVEKFPRLKSSPPRSISKLEELLDKLRRGVYAEDSSNVEEITRLAERLILLQQSLETAYDYERLAQVAAAPRQD